jgi:hypothetical protein
MVWHLLSLLKGRQPSGATSKSRKRETLVVVNTGVDIGGNYTTTQRFTYEKPHDSGIVKKLIGYSGGFVKNSIIAQQVITIEYVTLKGSYKEITLGCPMGLPGVDVAK